VNLLVFFFELLRLGEDDLALSLQRSLHQQIEGLEELRLTGRLDLADLFVVDFGERFLDYPFDGFDALADFEGISVVAGLHRVELVCDLFRPAVVHKAGDSLDRNFVVVELYLFEVSKAVVLAQGLDPLVSDILVFCVSSSLPMLMLVALGRSTLLKAFIPSALSFSLGSEESKVSIILPNFTI
jgi:hypothetical protein